MRKLKKDKYIGGGAKRHGFKIFNAFTLAEMMVVMLIVSIVLAAMAPVMTTKNKVDNSSPWRYSPANSSDAYFGAGEAMRALIGQVNGEDTDLGKLIINNNATGNSHILFKSNNDILGDLYFNGTSLILGERRSRSTEAIGNENINIGHENWPTTDITGSSNITIGDASMRSLTTGSHNIGLGTTLGAVSTGSNNIGIGDDSIENTNGDYNIAVGTHAYRRGTGGSNVIVGGDAMSKYSGNNNVVMGTQAMYYGSGNNNVAIGTNANYNGTNSEVTYEGTTAVGHNAQARSLNSTAIGREAIAGTAGNGDYFANAVAVGYKANAEGAYAVSIGENSNATAFGGTALGRMANSTSDNAIAINGTAAGFASVAMGIGSSSSGSSSVAIGNGASSTNQSALAIGSSARAAGQESIAIGSNTNANGYRNTAIGTNACRFVTGSNKTCIGANSGPASGSSLAVNNNNVMFLGDSTTTVYIPGNLIVGGNVALATNRRSSVFARLRTGVDYWYAYLEMTDGGGAQTVKQTGLGRTKNDVSFYDAFSDRRLKYVGKENTSGLDKIKQLKVFNYVYKKDATKTPHVGVIAQDLQKVFPNAVKKGADGFLTIRMEDMFYAVINAIKELDAKVSALQKENQELRQLVKQVQEDNKRLDERLKKLEAKK